MHYFQHPLSLILRSLFQIRSTKGLLTPNAPEPYKDRSTLWNAIESVEKFSNSQLAREVEIALPKELTLEQQTALIRAYIDKNFVSQGMCAHFAIHNPPVTDDKGRLLDADGNPTHDIDKMTFRNPHAHIMLTMRPLNTKGEWQSKYQKSYLCRKDNKKKSIPVPEIKQAEKEGWKKQYRYWVGKTKIWLTADSASKKDLKRVDKQPKTENIPNPIIADWNSKDSLFRWRESWASMCNSALLKHGIHEQITEKSYESQDINKVASVHLGPSAYQAEKRGIQTELGSLNREISKDNEFLKQFENQIKKLEESETERLKQVSARLEGLRASYIAGAYQQICLSATLATEQDQNQTQMVIAAAYAKSAEKLMSILDTLEQSFELHHRKLDACNPLQVKRRKELESRLLEIEKQIQAVKGQLSELDRAYKDKLKAKGKCKKSGKLSEEHGQCTII